MYQPPEWWWACARLLGEGKTYREIAPVVGVSIGQISVMRKKMEGQELRLSENRDPSPLPVQRDGLTAVIQKLTRRQSWERG